MFCTSLRRRSFNIAPILPKLCPPSTLGLRENDLGTHDFALHISPKIGNDARQLRILLLSPSTVSESKLESSIERVQHLSHLTGGQDTAIVFLISPPVSVRSTSARALVDSKEHDDADGMLAYCRLQAELISHRELSMTILPMPTLEALPALLQRHLTAISGPLRVQNSVTTSFELLQHCTVAPRMRQQTAFLLSDSFDSIAELAEDCCTFLTCAPEFDCSSSPEATMFNHGVEENAFDKLKRLRNLVDRQEWENMIVLWQEEWTVE